MISIESATTPHSFNSLLLLLLLLPLLLLPHRENQCVFSKRIQYILEKDVITNFPRWDPWGHCNPVHNCDFLCFCFKKYSETKNFRENFYQFLWFCFKKKSRNGKNFQEKFLWFRLILFQKKAEWFYQINILARDRPIWYVS